MRRYLREGKNTEAKRYGCGGCEVCLIRSKAMKKRLGLDIYSFSKLREEDFERIYAKM
ncbi:hypothetical protein JCM12298_27730 [Desulfothermus naphthae]